MLTFFMWVLLLIYFWYFYYSESKLLTSPQAAGPDPATPFHLTYKRLGFDEFEFELNGTSVWNQTVPFYSVTSDKIQEIDECYQSVQNGQKIPAKGQALYQFVKKNPKFQSLVDTHRKEKKNTIFRHGTPFYFTCREKKIEALTLCAPGHIFENGACHRISSCTGQPNRKRFSHPDPSKWIECQNGIEHVKQCPPKHVFYGGNCVSEVENLCLFQKDLAFFKLDAMTLLGCQNYTPVYKRCLPGTRLFDSTVCEPSDCFGKPDEEKIPLRKRKRTPFEYVPGYSVCREGKVAETVECPSVWDPMLATEENLTMLPKVWDHASGDCSIPSLCQNVWPTEPDIYVRAHEYTRDLQNWSFSKYYDQLNGYVCNAQGLKQLEYIPVGERINEYFKKVPLCNENDPAELPLQGRYQAYYDCNANSYATCPAGNVFDGSVCRPDPNSPNVFKYQNYLYLFQFDPLNSEGWLFPHTKLSNVADLTCDLGFEYVKPYHICSHPECVPYTFLSMIPELSLFLPRDKKAQCTYDEPRRTLRKEFTSLNYTFWDQKVHHEKETIQTDPCQFGQHLKTGNYIWDRTVYATCDQDQPFVFCPSVHTRQIQTNTYECLPPQKRTLRHDTASMHINYGMNQFKRVRRVDKAISVQVQLNKGEPWREVPEEGLEIPKDMRLNLKTSGPVDLEFKYRVTFPPHICFEYTDQGRVTNISDHPSKIFNIKTESFEYGKFNFPRFRIQTFVSGFNDEYHPS